MMRIAFQGERFSNSEEAAACFAKKRGFTDVTPVPLVNAGPVIEAVLKGEADYGVCAVRNLAGGIVAETEEAVGQAKDKIRRIDCIWLPIHHCLFIRNENETDFHTVVSHVQALRQTKEFIETNFPGTAFREEKDTALAARLLAEGKLPLACAVICKKEAGEAYGLFLLRENIEDDRNNQTEFALYKRV